MLKILDTHTTRLLPANQRPRCRALIGGKTAANLMLIFFEHYRERLMAALACFQFP